MFSVLHFLIIRGYYTTTPGGSAPYCVLRITPLWGLVGEYQRFGGTYYLYCDVYNHY
jgi:hypothetical protein